MLRVPCKWAITQNAVVDGLDDDDGRHDERVVAVEAKHFIGK